MSGKQRLSQLLIITFIIGLTIIATGAVKTEDVFSNYTYIGIGVCVAALLVLIIFDLVGVSYFETASSVAVVENLSETVRKEMTKSIADFKKETLAARAKAQQGMVAQQPRPVPAPVVTAPAVAQPVHRPEPVTQKVQTPVTTKTVGSETAESTGRAIGQSQRLQKAGEAREKERQNIKKYYEKYQEEKSPEPVAYTPTPQTTPVTAPTLAKEKKEAAPEKDILIMSEDELEDDTSYKDLIQKNY